MPDAFPVSDWPIGLCRMRTPTALIEFYLAAEPDGRFRVRDRSETPWAADSHSTAPTPTPETSLSADALDAACPARQRGATSADK